MGFGLFDRFGDYVEKADRILGYSIAELCLDDPEHQLHRTQYTQPALYVVNALSYLQYEQENGPPDFVAGHSLGEYNALLVASVFDFETGLRLVKKRGELMATAQGGGMAAVVGLSLEQIRETLAREGHADIDVANFNAPDQNVISGPRDSIERAKKAFAEAGANLYVELKVSSAFHSRYMAPARREFEAFLAGFELKPPRMAVISNVEAREYSDGRAHALLAEQLTGSVRFVESIQGLLRRGVTSFHEVGPGNVLQRLVDKIKKAPLPAETPARRDVVAQTVEPARLAVEPARREVVAHAVEPARVIGSEALGSPWFRSAYDVRYAYVAGSLDAGVTSPALVQAMAAKGFLAFFGAASLPVDRVIDAIAAIRRGVGNRTFGVGIAHETSHPEEEEALVDALMGAGVTALEVRGFIGVTRALVRYRAHGLGRGVRRRILARASRPEIIEAFLAPAPESLLAKLVQEGAISSQDAAIARTLPMCDDICVDIESGWLADYGTPEVLLPLALAFRDIAAATHGYAQKPRVGMGGIGTPVAAASAFLLGAEFVLSGVVNAATVEAATSNAAKDLLERMGVQDTDFAPCPDRFELGGKIRVLKRGAMFAARATKLYELYRHHESIESLDERTRRQLEERIFHRSLDDVWNDVERRLEPAERARLERQPRQKMAAIFRSYLLDGRRRALEGDPNHVVDYLIPAAPSLGAFNEWARGTKLERWRDRTAVQVAGAILDGAADFIATRFRIMLPADAVAAKPARARANGSVVHEM
ncbi:ACP S-malonyltransferase [Pendulispora albinea]|uniref:[acyl-carrier-protein] S-malonyltransferase n=2 Tax=Pendulispora albinea TaxID=2741071 RepID=A0ABZ2MB21_9BACT